MPNSLRKAVEELFLIGDCFVLAWRLIGTYYYFENEIQPSVAIDCLNVVLFGRKIGQFLGL